MTQDLNEHALANLEACLERAFDSLTGKRSIGWETLKAVCWIAGADRDERWAMVSYCRNVLFEEFTDSRGLKRFRYTDHHTTKDHK